jgi:hypothetical protein
MKFRSVAAFAFAICLFVVWGLQAQDDPRPTVSPGVGSAVLLAKNSIQIDSGNVIASGDVIVNDATAGPVYGEKALSLDRTSHTAAGYKIAATSIDIDSEAVAGGDAYYNTLVNAGTIAGSQFTPLALPVFATLPIQAVRNSGTEDVVVPNFGSVNLDEGDYRNLTLGRGATVRFNGGGYAFASITADRDAQLRFAAPSDVVVNGRISLGRDTTVGPATGSGITAASIRIQANGINGSDGALLSSPSSIDIGNTAHIFANVQAANGSIVFGSGADADGAFFARDIKVGRDGHFTINSGLNRAPTANAQSVFTSGTSALTITLTGSDPEGSALTFSIVSGPSAGTLTSPVQASPTSATVVYTPAAAGVADVFTFRVRDAGGATGDAAVTINSQPEDPTPPNPTTVVATDGSAQTSKDVPATLLLQGAAPAGVSLTFSIVSGTGPSHGSLGSVTQGTESPQRTATVVYTPDAGYTGSDAFQFQACGVIAGNTVCDTASFNITVLEARTEPPQPTNLVNDVEVGTFAETQVTISLGSSSFSNVRVLTPNAAFLQPAAIAGNVADADNNGFGDNHNALPGSVPVFMSAGANQAGGPGSNGTVRMQMEWDITGFSGGADSLQSATVNLPTHRGTTDSVDTFFWWISTSGDGALSDSDFEAPAERISGVAMPVPPSMSIGDVGTFSFSVLSQLRDAAHLGHTHFVVQGRVDESAASIVRGLEVRTTASGNLPYDVPSLAIATPGIAAPLIYTITSLPASGLLYDSANTLITSVPYTLPDAQVRYTPNTSFIGDDTFGFQATNNVIIDSALVTVRVRLANCLSDRDGCNNGR